jgi:hypothetical protein
VITASRCHPSSLTPVGEPTQKKRGDRTRTERTVLALDVCALLCVAHTNPPLSVARVHAYVMSSDAAAAHVSIPTRLLTHCHVRIRTMCGLFNHCGVLQDRASRVLNNQIIYQTNVTKLIPTSTTTLHVTRSPPSILCWCGSWGVCISAVYLYRVRMSWRAHRCKTLLLKTAPARPCYRMCFACSNMCVCPR